MRKIPVHIDKGFAEGFFYSLPEDSGRVSFLRNREELQLIDSMLELLFKKSNINFEDISSAEELVDLAKDNPLFHELIDRYGKGSIDLNFSRDADLTLDRYPAFFMRYNLEQRERSRAFLFSDLGHWKEDIEPIMRNRHFQLNRNNELNNFPGWTFLKDMKIPCNSAVIHDRYLFSSPETMDKNLFSLIDAIIPKELKEIPFHLTIIAREREVDDPKGLYNRLSHTLDRKYGDRLKWGLSLVKYTAPHDREILTNYYRLSSQDSFNYYDQRDRIRTNTKLDFMPIICGDLNNYFSKLSELFEANNRSIKFGHKYNRLFDLLKL